jgi:gamma-glutamyltranspeptidase/glutathione hydrolase
VDAAIAVQMVLTLVEPQSSGIGGGAFLLHHNGKNVEALTAAKPRRPPPTKSCSSKPTASPWPSTRAWWVAARSARAGHRAHAGDGAQATWQAALGQLFQPAITLAEGGFKVSARLNTLLKGEQHLKKDPVAAAYFYDAERQTLARGPCAEKPRAGRRCCVASPPRARKALMEGDVAQAIVDKVQKHPTNPGKLSLADLAGYQPKARALCHDYGIAPSGKDFRICGFPPPSSGAIAVGQILGILNHTYAGAIPLENGLPGPVPTGCTCTPRPPAWPLPTARSTWPTPTSCSHPAAAG